LLSITPYFANSARYSASLPRAAVCAAIARVLPDPNLFRWSLLGALGVLVSRVIACSMPRQHPAAAIASSR
jgi:hypothetical protein